MTDTTRDFDADLQQTVEFLLEARPDLIDPARLQLFERLLNSHIEIRKAGLGLSTEHVTDKQAEPNQRPMSKFMAVTLDLVGAYVTAMFVYLVFPAVPLFLLPFFAVAGFFVSRYWDLADNSSTRRSR